MSAAQVLGVVLIALPFVVLLTGWVRVVGWRTTLVVLALSCAAVLLVLVGVGLVVGESLW